MSDVQSAISDFSGRKVFSGCYVHQLRHGAGNDYRSGGPFVGACRMVNYESDSLGNLPVFAARAQHDSVCSSSVDLSGQAIDPDQSDS
jgi:hypothetical protein